jgi:hypothetical protein
LRRGARRSCEARGKGELRKERGEDTTINQASQTQGKSAEHRIGTSSVSLAKMWGRWRWRGSASSQGGSSAGFAPTKGGGVLRGDKVQVGLHTTAPAACVQPTRYVGKVDGRLLTRGGLDAKHTMAPDRQAEQRNEASRCGPGPAAFTA